jgi:hypothetical protein
MPSCGAPPANQIHRTWSRGALAHPVSAFEQRLPGFKPWQLKCQKHMGQRRYPLNLMERVNPEGIVREDLAWALNQRGLVFTARRMNTCLVCRRRGVDESGLCNVCTATLSEQEQDLVEKWRRGTGP